MNEIRIYQAINAVSQRVNNVQKLLDRLTLAKHQENADKITEDESGMIDIAELIDEQNDAILELADIVSQMAEGEEV
jgi:methyl-accepting chemotaxis protein